MSKKAFTLIELLVVISIIAMLLAILMPALGIVKQKAQGVVCLANLDSLSKAWFIYSTENSGKLVGGTTESTTDATWNLVDNSPKDPWVLTPQTEGGANLVSGSEFEEEIIGIERGLMWPYLETHKVYHCNSDKRYKEPPVNRAYGGKGGYRTYSIVSGANGFPHRGAWGLVPYTRQTQIRQPSSKYIFVEEIDARGFNMGSWCVPPTGDTWTDPIAMFHNDASTFGFADGHSELHKWRDKDTIEWLEREPDNTSLSDPGSEDLIWVQKHLPYLRLQP